jgi:hypothetical protein
MESKEEITISKLNELYNKAETCDKDLFSEQRSNILLTSGDHYKRTSSRIWGRVKDSPLSTDQKLRLVKNHTGHIMKGYVNNIASYAPGVRAVPHNETEMQDQKAAELNQAVLSDAKQVHRLRDRIRDWIEDYCVIGEVACKIFWDPSKGKLKGYNQKMSEQGEPMFTDLMGEPTVEPMDMMTGQPHEPLKDDKSPVFDGEFVFESIYAFNLLRAPWAQTMEESPYIIVRKMVEIDKAKFLCQGDEDKLKMIEGSAKSTFRVFDRGEWVDAKNQVMFREHYYRPCPQYPNGYFYITTEEGILFEGELPYGLFPIVYRGFDKIQTSPRARSKIKQLRPYQAEINRAASQAATTQITLGDDKILIQSGTKITKGGELPGIRVLNYSGAPPTILAGRSGEQFAEYISSNIAEMYQIANYVEDKEEVQTQLDPHTMLYRSLRNKKRFAIYAEGFESFLVDLFTLFLKLAKQYYPDDRIIRAVGRSEALNIAEFKNTSDMDFSLKLEPMSDDVESMLGKQIQFNHILQYIGQQLPKETIGMMMRAMPFVNQEEAFIPMLQDYDNIKSDILALDRGEFRPASPSDNHELYIPALETRMKKGDFRLLPPQIQQMYLMKKKQHEQAAASEASATKSDRSRLHPKRRRTSQSRRVRDSA